MQRHVVFSLVAGDLTSVLPQFGGRVAMVPFGAAASGVMLAPGATAMRPVPVAMPVAPQAHAVHQSLPTPYAVPSGAAGGYVPAGSSVSARPQSGATSGTVTPTFQPAAHAPMLTPIPLGQQAALYAQRPPGASALLTGSPTSAMPAILPNALPATAVYSGGHWSQAWDTIAVYIPAAFVGAIIGRSGSIIKELSSQTRCAIWIVKGEDDANGAAAGATDAASQVGRQSIRLTCGVVRASAGASARAAATEKAVLISGRVDAQFRAQVLIHAKVVEGTWERGGTHAAFPVARGP